MRANHILGTLAFLSAASLGCLDPVVTDLGAKHRGGDGTPTPAPTGLPATVTYWKDIKSVLDVNCVECHTPGGVGAFSLDTYEKARSYAAISASAVEGKRMPPWPPDPSCNEYRGQRVLSDLQRALFRAWVDQGTPEGNPADYTPATPAAPELPLGTPDRTLDAGGDYTFDVANGPQDLYWCFRMNPNITQATDFVAADIIPGNKEIVHHVIVFREANGQNNPTGLPGFQCDGAPGEFLFAWVPGAGPLRFPEGIGMQLQPNDRLLMQMHYSKNPMAATQVDRTKATLYFAGAPVQQRARVLWLGTIGIDIPAGQEATASGECQVPNNGGPLNVLMTAPHMHKLAVSHKATVRRNDGSESCLVEIPRWDFGWQGGYMMKNTFQVMPGETITTTCKWKNDTNQNAGFGEGTGDEMCFNFLYVTGNPNVRRYCFPGGALLELSGLFGAGATSADDSPLTGGLVQP